MAVLEGDYMSIDIICREVSRLMHKYDEPDPWKLADAMGIIVCLKSIILKYLYQHKSSWLPEMPKLRLLGLSFAV